MWVCVAAAGAVLPAALAYPLLVAVGPRLVLVLVVGIVVNGNQHWIDVGGPSSSSRPSSAKLALVLWGADLLARKARKRL